MEIDFSNGRKKWYKMYYVRHEISLYVLLLLLFLNVIPYNRSMENGYVCTQQHTTTKKIKRKYIFPRTHVKGWRKLSSFQLTLWSTNNFWHVVHTLFCFTFFILCQFHFVETLLEKPFNNEFTKMYILSMLIIGLKNKKYKHKRIFIGDDGVSIV